MGTGFLSSFSASFADLTGGRSGLFADKLQTGKEEAMKKLEGRARQLGGNAIIGIDIDYTTFTSDIMGIIVNGTAVKIEKIADSKFLSEIQNFSYPIMSYNPNLPFNVCEITFLHNLSSNLLMGNVTVRNYLEGYYVTSLITDIEIKSIFGDITIIPDTIFTWDTVGESTSNMIPISLGNVQKNTIGGISLNIKKFIVNANEKVISVEGCKKIKISSIVSRSSCLYGGDFISNGKSPCNTIQ